MFHRCYYVYIVTNVHKTVLYTGVTNNLQARLLEHYNAHPGTFTGAYRAHYLLYYEADRYVLNAIAREKEIKGWTRRKKCALINTLNPEWRFLNDRFFAQWPPPPNAPRLR
ncbi:MAG: GIY-YIG nuclease family protein [Chitinophagaceae bacterium]|nr:MAG: GIY-YIG nuclease family protein [Chitinophagaceae bacterium]